MVRRCCISGCVNSSSSPTAVIHRFPNSSLKGEWIQAVSSKCLEVNLQNYGVCALHFLVEDYVKCGSASTRTRLGPSSVPSLFTAPSVVITAPQPVEVNTMQKYHMNENDELKKQLRQARKALSKKKVQLKGKEARIGQLEKQVETLQETVNHQSQKLKHLDELESNVQKIFTEKQVQCLIGNENFVHWSETDIARSIALYSVSSKSYNYMRKELHYPLPSSATIHRWLSKIIIQPGLLIPVLNLLKLQLVGSTPLTKAATLAFDELSIDEKYCYDAQLDQIFGKEKCANATLVRGLFCKWKQMIQYDFEKINCELLLEMLEATHNAGVDVYAVTCDMGTKNQAVWRDLGICKVKDGELGPTSFPHPSTKKNVWVFPDYPHLLKLLRSHFIDDGLTLPDGTKLDKSLILDILQVQREEYKLTHKMTYKHVYLRNKQRQNVRSAFQLFSNSMGTAIQTIFPDKTSEAEFFIRINNLSDLMNVRVVNSSDNMYKLPFGKNLDEQIRFLEDCYDYFKNIIVGTRCRKRKTYAPFQKGFLIAIKSLLGLYKDMSQPPINGKYLLTSHLNQDFVENTFSILRGIGGFNTNPTPVDLKNRIKKQLVGWNLASGLNTPVEMEDNNENLTSAKFKQLILCEAPVTKDFDNEMEFEEAEISLMDIPTDLPRSFDKELATISEVCEEGGREYVAGFIAQKLKEKFPHLKNESSVNSGFWIKSLSNGHLVEPSEIWLAHFRRFEDYFRHLHPDKGVDRKPDVIKRLVNILISAFPEVPEEIIKYYAKCRTMIRIKSLNKEMESQKFTSQENQRCARQKENELFFQAQMDSQNYLQQDHAKSQLISNAETGEEIDALELDEETESQLDEMIHLVQIRFGDFNS